MLIIIFAPFMPRYCMIHRMMRQSGNKQTGLKIHLFSFKIRLVDISTSYTTEPIANAREKNRKKKWRKQNGKGLSYFRAFSQIVIA